MSLLSAAEQHGVLTLLASTSIPSPSPLWTTRQDVLHQQSRIDVLPDTEVFTVGSVMQQPERGTIMHNVVHLSSPSIRGTYVQAGTSVSAYQEARRKANGGTSDHKPLGMVLPWLGLQIRPLGRRPMSIEVCVVDNRGVEGIVRISTFKHEPSIHQHRQIPLLHLPLITPQETSTTLTPWLDLSIDLNKLIPLFTTLAGRQRKTEPAGVKKRRTEGGRLPSGKLGSVSYVRVYANCRVRRIWFSEDGERSLEGLGSAGQEEWALYASAEV